MVTLSMVYRTVESSTTPGRDIWVSIRTTGGLKLVLEPEGVADLVPECSELDLDCIALTLILFTGVEALSKRLSLPVNHQVIMEPFPCRREEERALSTQKHATEHNTHGKVQAAMPEVPSTANRCMYILCS